ESEWAASASALEAAQAEHRAHAVMADLVAGEPCPVGQQVVDTLPAATAPADLDRAQAARAHAHAAVGPARAAHADTSAELVRVETKLNGLDQQLADLDAAIAAHPDRAAIEAQLKEHIDGSAAVDQARADEKKARTALSTATVALNKARARQSDA